MRVENIHKQLDSILSYKKKIDYHGITLYLVNKVDIHKILQLELTVRTDNIEQGIEKKNHFYDYAKIINPKTPAFKYTLSMKHKKKEIFNPIKVKESLSSEYEIWKNKSRVMLEKKIQENPHSISNKKAKILRLELEQEIISAKEKVETVLENYHNYDVIISTFEEYTYYPALYYVMELTNGKTKASDTHLRKDIPNILYYHNDCPYSELRANDKMSRIIQDFDRFCDSIYIKKKQ